MKAILLAGGKGSRLKPYTAVIPKPLMPIGERTIVEILLAQLARAGVTEVVMCVGHLAHLIEAVVGEGSRYGLRIEYRREREPLGTAGPLKTLAGELPEHFLVMNGDILCDIDFAALYRAAVARRAPLTVAVCERQSKVDFGVVELGSSGDIAAFGEKPIHKFWVSMGIYAMSREVLDFIPSGRPFGFDDLMHALLAEKRAIQSFQFRGHWLDIGRSDDFAEAQEEFAKNAHRYLPNAPKGSVE